MVLEFFADQCRFHDYHRFILQATAGILRPA